MNNYERFMNAFTAIEKYLRKYKTSDKTHESFYGLVEKAKKKDAIVRQYELDLKELADLRNAITHERTDGHPIAEPYPSTVDLIEKICNALKNPPRAREFQGKVSSVSPEKDLKDVLEVIRNNAYSQVPVYDDSGYRGILTTNTIARWLSSTSEDGLAVIDDVKVSEVLEHAEDSEMVEFVKANDNLFEVLDLFSKANENGRKLEAIIITQNGKKKEKPLGIITVWDIPKILKKLR